MDSLDGENDEELMLLTFINHKRDVNVQQWKNVILNSNLFCKYMSCLNKMHSLSKIQSKHKNVYFSHF